MIHWMTLAVTSGVMLMFWRMERNSSRSSLGDRETRQTVSLIMFAGLDEMKTRKSRLADR